MFCFVLFCFVQNDEAKKSKRWANYVFLCKICAEGIFLSFPWWLKNVKSGSKITLFQMDTILECVFQKWKQLHFSDENYLIYTKKDTILHVTITFFLKQGQTRTSSGPITVPLIIFCVAQFIKTCISLPCFFWHFFHPFTVLQFYTPPIITNRTLNVFIAALM